jgi:phosphoglycerol transferase MdoB-like AlkP superfamily enzyme
VFKDSATQKLLLRHFTDPALAKRYQVKIGTVPFHGSTIHGEFRELCQVRLDQYGDHLPSGCLPALLSAKGYVTEGYHGFSNQFYQRYAWYPKIGFEKTFFAEELKAMGVGRTCGSSFIGICDADVAQVIRKELLPTREGKAPRFIHWMTLNSHLPIMLHEGKESTLDCSKSTVLSKDGILCTHAHLIDRVLESVVALAEDPAILPTRFIIVGDHAPPFKTPTQRLKYESDTVTSIELRPVR